MATSLMKDNERALQYMRAILTKAGDTLQNKNKTTPNKETYSKRLDKSIMAPPNNSFSG